MLELNIHTLKNRSQITDEFHKKCTWVSKYNKLKFHVPRFGFTNVLMVLCGSVSNPGRSLGTRKVSTIYRCNSPLISSKGGKDGWPLHIMHGSPQRPPMPTRRRESLLFKSFTLFVWNHVPKHQSKPNPTHAKVYGAIPNSHTTVAQIFPTKFTRKFLDLRMFKSSTKVSVFSSLTTNTWGYCN